MQLVGDEMKNEILVGEEKAVLSPKKKKKIVICVIAAALIVFAVTFALLFNFNSTVQTKVYTEALYALMPKEITTTVGSDPSYEITLGVRKNPKFDAKKQSKTPLVAFEFYFYNEKGELVELGSTGSIVVDGADYGPGYLSFLVKAKENLNTVKSVSSKVIIVLVVLAVCGLIVLWFKVWSKKEDEKKEQRLISNGSKKKKNKR